MKIGSFNVTRVQLIYEGQPSAKVTVNSHRSPDRTEFWWDPKRPDEPDAMGQQDPNWVKNSSTKSSATRYRWT